MKEILEYLKELWGRWGWTIVVMVVAFALYIVGVEFASSCYNDANAPVEITIDENGHLGIQYVFDDH
ncbi:MAG: hypothetical protein IJV71_07890, partial [Lachnospiraceae bacterium]|nr:hypothetical protein [Lachnospiraceae bacterium]